MCPPELLDEQLLGADKMLEENLEIKRQQLRRLNQQLMETQNKITSAKLQFDNECKQERSKLNLEHDKKMKEVQQLMAEADQQVRNAQESYYRQMNLEKDAKNQLLRVNEQKAKLGELNVERAEIAKLRLQAEKEMQQAVALSERSRAELQNAQMKLDEANQKVAAAEKLSAQYKEDWNRLKSEQDEVARQLKQYQILKEEIDGKLSPKDTKKDEANGGSAGQVNNPSSGTKGQGSAKTEAGSKNRGT